MISIVYPYYEGTAIWEELRYSLRSLSNFTFLYNVVIVGDLPVWCKNVIHIPSIRIPGKFGNARDSNTKILKAINDKRVSRNMLLMHDDMYVISPVTLGMVKELYYVEKLEYRNDKSRYSRLIWKTFDSLHERYPHAPIYNFETHIPRLYDADFLGMLMNDYSVLNNDLLYATIYFNEFLRCTDNKLKEGLRKVRSGFYGSTSYSLPSHTDHQVQDACDITRWSNRKKRYISHNDYGLTSPLQKYLKMRFPNKSRYE